MLHLNFINNLTVKIEDKNNIAKRDTDLSIEFDSPVQKHHEFNSLKEDIDFNAVFSFIFISKIKMPIQAGF